MDRTLYKKNRYELIDLIRGITIISMITYHLLWDLVHLANVNISWYHSEIAYIWQQSICWSFILISGFCWSMGKNKAKQGLIVFGAGALVTLVTIFLMPDQLILFGILTFLGSAMLLMIPLEKALKKINPYVGIVIFFILFILFKPVNRGYLVSSSLNLKVPDFLYEGGNLSAFLGFPAGGFFSTDYFSILPWIFLYITGYFLYLIFIKKNLLNKKFILNAPIKWVQFMGKHSLIIYLIHQPVLYLIVQGIY